MTHLKILELLEDPDSDNDEINEKFARYLGWSTKGTLGKYDCWYPDINVDKFYLSPPDYTTSLDAIKTVQPEGLGDFVLLVVKNGDKFSGEFTLMVGVGELNMFKSPHVSTEERARLHAVIQGIAHMRENEG